MLMVFFRLVYNLNQKNQALLAYRHEWRAEARTAADAPEADASEATDNSESCTAAVNAADGTEDANLKTDIWHFRKRNRSWGIQEAP